MEIKIKPIHLVLLAGGGFYVWKKRENPAWSPFAWLFSSPFEKHAALEHVKITSVPTPDATAALDKGMSTDQVKQVNSALTTETDPKNLAAQAQALGEAGHVASASAVAAKADAVMAAKALGASDADVHKKQIEAVAPAAASSSAVKAGWGPFGTHGWGYPWGDVQYGPSYHPAEYVGHDAPPGPQMPWDFPMGFVGAADETAHLPWGFPEMRVGIQSGPAIVGWDGRGRHGRFEHARERFGRHGRYGHGRERFGRERFEHHRHHRHHWRPEEEEVIDVEPEVEEVMQPPPPAPPPPAPMPEGGVTEGRVTAGFAQYGGGGLVAEYPGVPQQAQYAQPQQYVQQQFQQQYTQPQYAQQYAQPVYEYARYPEYAWPERWEHERHPWHHHWGHRHWW